MDKNTATGLALIFLLMLGWFYFTMPSEEELAQQRREQAIQDSLAALEQVEMLRDQRIAAENEEIGERVPDQVQPVVNSQYFASVDTALMNTVVETPNYRIVFSNQGAAPISFVLTGYNTWDGTPVELISDSAIAAYSLGFLSTENYNIDTKNLRFTPIRYQSSISVEEGGQAELTYALPASNGGEILFTYTFFGDSHAMELDVTFKGTSSFIVGRSVDLGWTSPLPFTEKDKTQDALETTAYVYAGGELEKFKIDDSGAEDITINGTIDWVATKTKFFTQIIKPTTPTEAAEMRGEVTGESDDPLTRHDYTSSVRSDIPANETISYQLYVGPMRYAELKDFDDHAYDMVDVGWSWLRWFSDPFVRFLVIPFFEFMSGIVSNVGIIIIIFAASIKLVLSPLTYKSYKSMAAMQDLQPKMKELQEKYKDNPQKQQQETMKLYRKEKVNPLGGCLPNLLQFPILITLWRFFQNSMLLRQEGFLWAQDLSAPDYIINLPFSIPFMGDQIAGFVLMMTAVMVVQSRLTGGASTGATNPMAQQMKVMQYIFPVMLLFIFNNFASGLSLYYLIFNVLSVIQQIVIKRNIHAKKEAASA
ncbi:MAG: membrane protein insertase YidC [Bacteroidota bacterium]